MYKYILFDLDGTLTDSGEGIMNSVRHALSKRGIFVDDENILKKFIGPPLTACFQELFGFSSEEALVAVEDYREYFADRGIFENRIYRGVKEMLGEIKKSERVVILSTSKPEVYAKRILEHFGLLEFFDYVVGATMDETRNKKGDVIRYALSLAGIKDKREALMVGDRKHDVLGAKENGIDSLGVLYGYGDRLELEEANADYIAKTVNDILNYV